MDSKNSRVLCPFPARRQQKALKVPKKEGERGDYRWGVAPPPGEREREREDLLANRDAATLIIFPLYSSLYSWTGTIIVNGEILTF